jgi:hypothetical protein
VAKRIRGFVDRVNRISATETLEHEVVDRHGLTTKPRPSPSRTSNTTGKSPANLSFVPRPDRAAD